MNQSPVPPKILVAPLDWGLGHATRCIPVIRELIAHNCHVILAASGKGKILLQQEFPFLRMLPLPGYEIAYAVTGWGLALKIVAQIPKLLRAIKREHLWLQNVVADEGLDAVISDNRYGLHHPQIRSVFISHQLCIQTPARVGENFLQRLNYRYLAKFQECWVPDTEGGDNLAGKLSHPMKKPGVLLFYTGPLTRFGRKVKEGSGQHLLLLLSGPEPQRTLLEEQFIKELKSYSNPVVVVRGLPGEVKPLKSSDNVVVYNHLPAAELEQVIADASLVISRCGYSTVMDLAALQKKSILIPTPGQTEQEYLAKHLMQKGFALCVEQKKFRLKNALALAENFPFRQQSPAENKQSEVVEGFVERVQASKTTTTGKPANTKNAPQRGRSC